MALAWLVWVMMFYGRPLVQSGLVAFDVMGEHRVEATVTVVRKEPDVMASCLLRAFAADHTIVGELNFTVGRSQPEELTLTRTIRTEREATSVSMEGCRADGRSRRR